jgi:hypothetical protein
MIPKININILKIEPRKLIVVVLTLLMLLGNHMVVAQESKEKEKKENKFSLRDPEDGAIDISSFLDQPEGFMPVPIIITEPAVGYGGGLAVLFFQPQKKKYDVRVPPNITGVAGLGTQNKTWAAAVFHFHVWGPDKIRYLGAVAKPTIHIKYYGNNNDFLSKNPVKLELDAWAVLQRVQVRIAKSDLFLGGAYILFTTKNTLDTLPDKPVINKILNKLSGRSTISMLQPIIDWDSRNNIFSPFKGINTGVMFSYSATWLGADNNYYSLNPYFFGYQPVSKRVFSSWRFDAGFMFGDAPLYALPFIQLRGVPAMRYQSNNTMLVETQWDFKVYKRWSLDVFTGTGKAFTSFSEFGPATWVYNYGVGIRYEIARALGIHAGLDFAWSNNGEFAFYVIFGSAWNK